MSYTWDAQEHYVPLAKTDVVWIEKSFRESKKMTDKDKATAEKLDFDPYEVLEVSEGATEDELKTKFRKAALKWHPDKNPDRIEQGKPNLVRGSASGVNKMHVPLW